MAIFYILAVKSKGIGRPEEFSQLEKHGNHPELGVRVHVFLFAKHGKKMDHFSKYVEWKCKGSGCKVRVEVLVDHPNQNFGNPNYKLQDF